MTAQATRYSALFYQTRRQWTLALWALFLLLLVGALGLLLLRQGPNPVLLAWMVYLLGGAAIIAEPRYGLYLILFFGLLADAVLIPWYPFTKNFSSGESIFYLNSAIIFSPLELYLMLTAFSWGARFFVQRKLSAQAGPIGGAMLLFTGSLVVGLGYGLARGGSMNIALWEVRPIFYLPLMYVLVLNLVQRREHVSTLMWVIFSALFFEGLVGALYFILELEMSLAGVEAITEHSAAIHMNTLFVAIIGVWMFKASTTKRVLLLWFAPLVALTYLATQRRAAFITLAVSLALIAIVLFKEQRRLFWTLIPPVALAGVVYLVLFWNSSGTLGMPARAIQSVFADEDSAEYASNIYRVLENVNIDFTIHQSPWLGVGFGRKFFISVPMADISFFDWWEYITHNSILWIWLKTGLIGFVSLLSLIGTTIISGTRTINTLRDGDLKAVALTMLLYVVMHFIYAYVDMSWDTQSMVYLGSAFALVGGLPQIDALPVRAAPRRWRWQVSR